MKGWLKGRLTCSQKENIKTMFYSPFWVRDILFCWLKGLRWNSSWQFNGLPIVHTTARGSILIGGNFICTSSPWDNSIGVFQKVILKTLKAGATINIGKNVGISGCTISAATSITLGDRVLIGAGCLITDSDAHPILADERDDATKIKSCAIVIEDDCFIGARSIILKGVRIGTGSVIGAGSVVTGDVPSGVIVAGNPARLVRKLN